MAWIFNSAFEDIYEPDPISSNAISEWEDDEFMYELCSRVTAQEMKLAKQEYQLESLNELRSNYESFINSLLNNDDRASALFSPSDCPSTNLSLACVPALVPPLFTERRPVPAFSVSRIILIDMFALAIYVAITIFVWSVISSRVDDVETVNGLLLDENPDSHQFSHSSFANGEDKKEMRILMKTIIARFGIFRKFTEIASKYGDGKIL